MKSSLSVCLGLAALSFCVAPAFADSFFNEIEAQGDNDNDSTSSAEILNLTPGNNSIDGVVSFGPLANPDDVDFFAIRLPALGLTSFTVTDPSGGDLGTGDFVLALYDPSGTLYIADDNSASGGALGGDPRIVADIQMSGIWYIAVSVFDYLPNPVAESIERTIVPAGVGALAADSPYKGTLSPGEVGEFKLHPSFRGGGRLSFFGDDSYRHLGQGNPMDPAFTLTIIANPEPGTLALFGLGLLGLVGIGRRRRRLRLQPAS